MAGAEGTTGIPNKQGFDYFYGYLDQVHAHNYYPEWLLRKPGNLTEAEMHLIRLHPIIGASLLSKIPDMETVVPIVLHHHECWDGSGYPRGLIGEDIPIGARILSVKDREIFTAYVPHPKGAVFMGLIEPNIYRSIFAASLSFRSRSLSALVNYDRLQPPTIPAA